MTMEEEGAVLNPYSKGTIRRIKLKNFLTYSATEFYPGPNMNMVIGPNGTGKSTVVCAIALGMGGRPDVLGRAKDLQEFIKHGSKKASIELELSDSPKNIIIQRSFEKGKNSSEWKLNGKALGACWGHYGLGDNVNINQQQQQSIGKKSTETEVKKIVRNLNIQVDNLCQFLPQDKVSGFAQMDPQRLLKETERAAGDNLLENHEKLASSKNDLSTLREKLAELERSLATAVEKNDRLKRDVERLNEREAIENQIEKIRLKIVIARYAEYANGYTEAKEAQKEAARLCDVANEALDPLKRASAEAKANLATSKEAENAALRKFNTLGQSLIANQAEIEDQDSKLKDLNGNAATVRKNEAKRKDKIVSNEKSLANVIRTREDRALALFNEGLINEDGTVPTPNPYMEKIAALLKESQEIYINFNADLAALNEEKGELVKKIVASDRKQKEKIAEVRALDDMRSRRFNTLIQTGNDKDVVEVIKWLRENRGIFKGRVIEPALLELEVVDPKFAAAIETAIPWIDQKAFIFEFEEDFRKFRTIILDQKKQRVSIKCPKFPLQKYIDEAIHGQDLKAFGMEGVLLDLVKGDPLLLAFLCENHNFHKFAYTTRELSNQQLSMAERRLPRFIHGIHASEDSRRRRVQNAHGNIHITSQAYGAISTRLQFLKYPTFLTSTVDPSLRDRLEAELQAIDDEKRNYDEEKTNLAGREETVNRKLASISEEFGKFKERRKLGQQKIIQYREMNNAIQTKRDDLERSKNAPSQAEQLGKIHREMLKVGRERVEMVVSFHKGLVKLSQTFRDRNSLLLGRIALDLKMQELEREIETSGEEAVRTKVEFDKAVALCKEAKLKARHSHEAFRTAKEKVHDSEEKLLLFQPGNLVEQDCDALDADLQDLIAKAADIDTVDPEILIEYNRRQNEIATLETSTRLKQKENEKLGAEIQEIEVGWKARIENVLETISGSFSESFNRIGCVGEVRLKEGEDYNKWGVEIMVKFRQTESLQALTATRQSGGERSVSTMLYLIALQSLSQSPFRVVDEINQGMDPRNERLVHKLIVKAACVGNTSQYFLITPKLLPDLEYHENMMVLCIFNGVWQPNNLELEVEKKDVKRVKLEHHHVIEDDDDDIEFIA